MHVEKNVCDNDIKTLLNVKGKTKDKVKVRQDLTKMDIHNYLEDTPTSTFSLSHFRKEKQFFCQCLRNVKISQSYSSNIFII